MSLNTQIETSNAMTVSDSLQLADQMIKNNLDKTLEWHSSNLKNNNILINRNQIKYILQKHRDMNFSCDDIFLLDISKIFTNQ